MTDSGVAGQKLVSGGPNGVPGWETPTPPVPTSPSWIIPPLLNSWTNYGTVWESVAYRKHLDDTVEIKGFVKGGLLGKPIFMLPTTGTIKYCPPVNVPRIVMSYTQTARVDITPLGEVLVRQYHGTGSNKNVCVDVRFPVTS
jgi:hypothetical protein